MKYRILTLMIIIILIFSGGCKKEVSTFSAYSYPIVDNIDVAELLGGYSGHYKIQSFKGEKIIFKIESYQNGEIKDNIVTKYYSVSDDGDNELNIYYNYENNEFSMIFDLKDDKSGTIERYTLPQFENKDINYIAFNQKECLYGAEIPALIMYERVVIDDGSSVEDIVDISSMRDIIDTSPNTFVMTFEIISEVIE